MSWRRRARAALLVAAPFAFPEIGAAVGGALGLGGAADLGLGAAAADIGAGGLAADPGIADIGGAAEAATAAGLGGAEATGLVPDALAFLPGGADALALAPTDALALGSDVLPENATLTTGTLDLGATDAGASAMPALNDAALEYPGYSPGQDTLASQAVSGTAADTGGGGIMQSLGLRNVSPLRLAAGLAPLGLALGMGGPKLPAGLGAAEANATALAQQGSNLNASQQASLTQMRQNAVNAARQALFNQGVKNPESDTRYSQMIANIDSQVTAAAQTMIQQNIQNSLAGDAQLIQIAQLQMQSDQNFANMLMNATKAFGTSIGLGGGQTFKLTPASS
jgi:hypothetical protein